MCRAALTLTLLFAILSPLRPAAADSREGVVTMVPDAPEKNATYVIYLHGKIIESGGPRPRDPRFGVYEYAEILDTLASRGAIVISEQRSANTDVNAFAAHVVSQIERLIHAGVDPSHIVVVGFSKGGEIALRTSSFLRRPEIRYVLLGACWDRSDDPQLRLTGHVLSILERSDTLANVGCASFDRTSERPVSFREIAIDTGLRHGAFYRPVPAWTRPTLDFIQGAGTR